MEQYVIKGGNPLVGEVEIAGAKNAALAILSAAIMTDETILIENLPDVRDINVLLEAYFSYKGTRSSYKLFKVCPSFRRTPRFLRFPSRFSRDSRERLR